MLKIRNRDVVFSKSFLMTRDEGAALNIPEFQGTLVTFFCTAADQEVIHLSSEDGIHLAFPSPDALPTSLLIDDFFQRDEEKFSLRFGAQKMGTHILVHVDIHAN